MEMQFASDMNACIASLVPGCNAAYAAKGTGVTAAFVEGCANAFNAQSCSDYLVGKVPQACAAPGGDARRRRRVQHRRAVQGVAHAAIGSPCGAANRGDLRFGLDVHRREMHHERQYGAHL